MPILFRLILQTWAKRFICHKEIKMRLTGRRTPHGVFKHTHFPQLTFLLETLDTKNDWRVIFFTLNKHARFSKCTDGTLLMLYAVTRIWAAFCFGKWQQSVLGIIGWFILHWNVKLEVPKWCLSLRGKGPPREEWLQRVWFILSVFMFTGCFIGCWDLWVFYSHSRRSQITWR